MARWQRAGLERGSAVVEFALVAPLFLFLVIGIIEFGWAFSQNLDVRHGARETARLVDVNYRATAAATGSSQTSQIVAAACSRMDADDEVVLKLSRTGDKPGASSEVTVSRPMHSITGMLDFIVGDYTISSSVRTRLEQEATWATTTGSACS